MCDHCERATRELVEVARAHMEYLPDLGSSPYMLLIWAAMRAARQDGNSVDLAHLMLRMGRDGLADAANATYAERQRRNAGLSSALEGE